MGKRFKADAHGFSKICRTILERLNNKTFPLYSGGKFYYFINLHVLFI